MRKYFKKFLFILGFVLFLVAPSPTFAIPPYVFDVTQSATSITAKLSGAPNDEQEYRLYNGNQPLSTNNLVSLESITKKPVNGTIVWTITGQALVNGTYNLSVMRLPPVGGFNPMATPVVVTETKTVTITASPVDFFAWPLNTSNPTGQSITLSGKVDIARYPNVANLEIQLKYSKLPFPTTGDPAGTGMIMAKNAPSSSTDGVATDGSYYLQVKNLDPKTKYYYRQNILLKGTTTVLSSKTSYFNSTDGYVPEGSTADQSAFNSKSYHLLAPWPGLAVLMDPDLCAQQKAENKVPQNAVCDINGFLNFVFKLLIGLTAVVLVLRLIYEGYAYMTTDVPFLKVSAKEGFKTALWGLLLALSAYLILNTINPKLVSNKFSVASVEVGVTPLAIIDSSTYSTLTGGKTILAPEEYLAKVKQYANGDKKIECLMVAAINNESHWRPNVIGCDECVGGATGNNVRSRKIFIQSGVKLDGSTLPPTASPTDRSMYNPNIFKSTEPGYGLDWRFSKGMGLTQVTVFPEGYNSPDSVYLSKVKPGGDLYINRANPANIKQHGSNETVLSFIKKNIDPDQNIQAGMGRMKAALQKCGGDIKGTFNAYSSGNCNNGINIGARMTDYNSCINGNIKIKTD